MPPQTQAPNVVVTPNVYIDVVINGQKMVYDVATATELRDALDAALVAFSGDQERDAEKLEGGDNRRVVVPVR